MEKESYYNPLPTNLRSLLDEHHTTITALAKELGITRQAVGQYCDGSGQPNAEKLSIIAQYFNVSVDWLLGLTPVRDRSMELSGAAEYIGLSADNVAYLRNWARVYPECCDWLFSNQYFRDILFTVRLHLHEMAMAEHGLQNHKPGSQVTHLQDDAGVLSAIAIRDLVHMFDEIGEAVKEDETLVEHGKKEWNTVRAQVENKNTITVKLNGEEI